MNFNDPKTQALLWRFVLAVLIVDIPVVVTQLTAPTFDWKLLLAGLLGGVAAVLEKSIAPQIADTYLLPHGGTKPH